MALWSRPSWTQLTGLMYWIFWQSVTTDHCETLVEVRIGSMAGKAVPQHRRCDAGGKAGKAVTQSAGCDVSRKIARMWHDDRDDDHRPARCSIGAGPNWCSGPQCEWPGGM